MKILKILLLLIFASYQSYSQEKYLKDLESAKSLSQIVAQFFQESKITEAVNSMRPYWPLPENEIGNLETKTIQAFNIMPDRFGKLEGITKINEKKLQETAFREVYFVRFELTAIRLIFIYYKGKKGWILNSFKWDDDFQEEFN